MIDLYFYFLKQNRVSIQVTVESDANVEYTIDCIKLGDDGFKSNSYMRINAKFLEDGLKEILDTFGMLEDFESRYLKNVIDRGKSVNNSNGTTIQMTQSHEGKFNYISWFELCFAYIGCFRQFLYFFKKEVSEISYIYDIFEHDFTDKRGILWQKKKSIKLLLIRW